MRMPTAWIVSVLLLLGTFAAARELPESDRRHYVVFCARGGLPGHAYLLLGWTDASSTTHHCEAIGYYPRKEISYLTALKSLWTQVPGELADEHVRGRIAKEDCRLVVWLNSEQYRAVKYKATCWQMQGYQVGARDCVSFTQEVAIMLGLKIPARRFFPNCAQDPIFPKPYIRKLADLNADR
jgi:hypothetical protein